MEEENKSKKDKIKKITNLNELTKHLNKNHGKGTAKIGNELPKRTPIICSTGSFSLDLAIDLGGIPESRILEYYGPPSGGKTTMTLISMIEAQKKEENCAFIDVEGTFDRTWFENLGGDMNKLIYIRPENGAKAFQAMEDIVRSGIVSIIGVDSVSTMVTDAETDSDYGDAMMTQLARLMSSSLKKINNIMGRNSKTSIIFINQTRVGNMSGYGNPNVSTGGNALPFYASVRLEVVRKDAIGEKTNPEGFQTRIKVIKNKVGKPFREVVTSLYIGPEKYGINIDSEVFDLAIYYDIIKKRAKDRKTKEFVIDPDGKGSWYIMSKKEEDQIYGRDKAINYFINNYELFEKIKTEVVSIVENKAKDEEDSFNTKMENKK